MTVRYHQNTTKQNISLFTLALFIEQNIFPEITFITFTLSIHQMILFEEYDVYGTYTVQKKNRITSAVSLRRFVKATSCNVIKKKKNATEIAVRIHFSHSTCHDMPIICIYTFIYNTF